MLQILGMGHYYPETVIDNKFLEELNIGTNEEWILERVGIKERRTTLSLEHIRQTRNKDLWKTRESASIKHHKMICEAANMALKRANLNAKDIGMVVCDPGGGDYWTPAVSNLVAAELGIEGLAFDLGTACSTFGLQLHMLANLNPDSTPDYILVGLGSPISWITNYDDRNTAVVFGDGAAVAIVSLKKPGKMVLEKSVAGNNSAEWEKIKSYKNGHFTMDGPGVQKFAIKKCIQIAKEVIETPGQWGDRYFIGHPANLLMLEGICNHLGVKPERHLHSLIYKGNCGQSSAPAVLSENWDKFMKGDEIVMPVVGGGLGWAALRIKTVSN